MALFKISKGNSADLGIKNGTNKAKEGYAYFTPDDGKFYIDIADANTVNLGVNRIALSSFKADLSQSFTVNLTERSSFWTLNIPGLKELKEGLILHISISTRPNDVYNVLNINGLGNKIIYYRYNEPLGDNISVPAELTLIYKDNLSSFDQVFTNENNQNISYGQSGWVIDSAYSINKSDIYYGNLAGNAATATQLYNTPYRQDVFLRGDNVWTNKIIGSLNVTDNIITNNINANQITPINNSFIIDGDIVTNGLFTIGNKDFSQIYTGQNHILIGNEILITNLNYSFYFEELSVHELYPWNYNEENNYWNILNTQDKHSLSFLSSGSWRALSNFALNINIMVHSESINWDYLIIQVNGEEKKRVGGNNQNTNITLFLKTNDIVNFIIRKDGSVNPTNEYYRAILSYQEYTSVYNITVNKNFIPENSQQTLGTIENKWKKLYVGSKETYGSTSQPIYWNDGIPNPITILGIEYGGTNTTSFINNNLIIYNNSKLQSLETKGDSKNKYLMSQGTDGPPIWSELSITLNGSAVTSPSFYAPTSAATGSGYILHWDDTNKKPVWTNILSVNHGGTGKSTWNQYGIIYANDTTSLTQVQNNTTSTRKFLRMVGSDSSATAPVWDTITKTDVGLSNVENTQLSTWAGTRNINTLGTIAIGTWQSSTIEVSYGGTGKTSFTANSIIMSGSTSTSALTTRSITDNSTNTAIATGTNIPTMNTLYYGLVAVNGSSQSRATTIYVPTAQGTSGQFLKSNGNNTPSWASLPTASSTVAGIIKIGTGSTDAAAGNHTHTLSIATTTETSNNITLTQGTKYKLTAGGSTYIFTMPAASTVTLNGTSTTSASFYAPTSVGTSGQFLKSTGSGAPSWQSFSVTLNNTSTTSASFYAPTGAGTSGQILKSNGSGKAPSWATEYSYTLPVASSTALGGIKTGYSASGKNYAVQLSDQKAYVNVPWTDTNTTNVKIATATSKYYLLGYTSTSHTTGIDTLYCQSSVYISLDTNNNSQLYANKVYNAVWNDYAEYRQTNDIQPGKVYQENDNGCMTETRYRLIPGCSIASDTFGSAMGKTPDAQTPMAVAGRVLAYTYQNRTLYHAGMAVCSAPNGTVDIMSREEIITYPDCIIGYVSEIPDYEEWGSGHIQVDGRIWIKVK